MGSPFIPPLSVSEIENKFPNLCAIKPIKSGGEGSVFKAFNKTLSQEIALKIYPESHLKLRAEFEVKKLGKLNSPYIIKLYEYGEVALRGMNCYFTETSYINGEDLRSLTDNGKKFSYNEVARVIECISQAIECLWHEKIVHCDIKPDNIIKNGNDYILIDLGIAKHLDAPTMTGAGMIMGTLGYLAPEQFAGRKNLTLKADYYALGIVAYELLTSYHPFNHNQAVMLTNNVPPFPLHLNIPDKLKELIYKMTNLISYNRPKNYNDIINNI